MKLSAKTPLNLYSIEKNKGKDRDPEGVEALNDIDNFEKKNAKKANRYPRDSYDTHANLETTMKARV